MNVRGLASRTLLVLYLCVSLSAAALPQEEAKKLLAEANNLFRQANEVSLKDPNGAVELYQRAALRFERIVRDGAVRNGKLFYNLGNAYFRSQDLGRAILNYLRALKYMPGDVNLRQNLEFARNRRPDRFEEKQGAAVRRTLLFWHYDLSPASRLGVFAVFSGIFWVLAALRLKRRDWAPRPALIVVGIIAALFLGSLLAQYLRPGRSEGVVLAREVIGRKGDGISYEPAFKEPLHAGTEFRLLESREDWRQIELPDGRTCWIPADAAGLVETEPPS